MDLIEEFCNEHLGGEIDRLADFCLAELNVLPRKYEYAKYASNGVRWNFDCDDCALARAVYERIWGVTFPEFRGDTMNSFRTTFGSEWTTGTSLIPRENEIISFASFDAYRLPEFLKNRIWAFHRLYHTIGNFIPLPNRRLGRNSINTFRACAPWYDSFGVFLSAVKKYLTGRGMVCGMAELPDLFVRLMDENAGFWDRYRGEDGFGKYIAEFMLEEYLGLDGEPIPYEVTRWKTKGLSGADYRAGAVRFLDRAERIIRNRARRIIAKLSGTATASGSSSPDFIQA